MLGGGCGAAVGGNRCCASSLAPLGAHTTRPIRHPQAAGGGQARCSRCSRAAGRQPEPQRRAGGGTPGGLFQRTGKLVLGPLCWESGLHAFRTPVLSWGRRCGRPAHSTCSMLCTACAFTVGGCRAWDAEWRIRPLDCQCTVQSCQRSNSPCCKFVGDAHLSIPVLLSHPPVTQEAQALRSQQASLQAALARAQDEARTLAAQLEASERDAALINNMLASTQGEAETLDRAWRAAKEVGWGAAKGAVGVCQCNGLDLGRGRDAGSWLARRQGGGLAGAGGYRSCYWAHRRRRIRHICCWEANSSRVGCAPQPGDSTVAAHCLRSGGRREVAAGRKPALLLQAAAHPKPCWLPCPPSQDAEALQAQQRQLQGALAAAQDEAAALASQLQAARALAPQVRPGALAGLLHSARQQAFLSHAGSTDCRLPFAACANQAVTCACLKPPLPARVALPAAGGGAARGRRSSQRHGGSAEPHRCTRAQLLRSCGGAQCFDKLCLL